jgi:hypothetical protein
MLEAGWRWCWRRVAGALLRRWRDAVLRFSQRCRPRWNHAASKVAVHVATHRPKHRFGEMSDRFFGQLWPASTALFAPLQAWLIAKAGWL